MPKYKKSSNNHAFQARSGHIIPFALDLGILAGVVLIAVSAFVAYLPSLSGGFIMDDDLLLTKNDLIKAPDSLYRFWYSTESLEYYPLTYDTLWIEWRLWEMNTTGYKVINLILHIVSALLIWIILRKLSIPGAFLAALIFAVHPVNVESVAWIAQRRNVLAMLFFLLSILCYLNDFTSSCRDKAQSSRHTPCADPAHGVCGVLNDPAHGVCGLLSGRWYWLSLAMFLLAMLSKGSVAVLPVLLLVIIWWLRPAETVSTLGSTKMGLSHFLSVRDLIRLSPFFLIAAVLTVLNIWFQTHGSGEEYRTAGFLERLLGAGCVVWFYLYKAFLPFDLAFVYQHWNIQVHNPLWWLPLLAALVITAVLWRYRTNWSRPLLFAWCFFCVTLVPALGFVDVGFMKYSLVADHYQHIAIIGAIALAASVWSIWHQRMRGPDYLVANAVAAVAACTLIFLTWRQSGLYRDAMTLYQATLKKNPECWLAYDNLGNALSDSGRLKEAIEQYEKALRLNPDDSATHSNLGNALVKTGRPQESIKHCEQALKLNPNFPEAHNNMGNALVQTGRFQEGIKHYEQAIRLKPNYVNAHYNLGLALIQAGRYSEAIEHFQQALALKPDFAEIHNNLGVALFHTGRPWEAIEHYQQTLLLKPDFSDAHYNLGNVLESVGQFQQAIEHYKQTLTLKPNDPEAHYNLGNALVQLDRPQEAIDHYRQALRLKPDYTDAYSNLALIYAGLHQSPEAIAAAQKALELARSQGQAEQCKQIENWLNTYRASPSGFPSAQPSGKSAPPTP
jgi:tetratricopeptide (TPR) repeat protein